MTYHDQQDFGPSFLSAGLHGLNPALKEMSHPSIAPNMLLGLSTFIRIASGALGSIDDVGPVLTWDSSSSVRSVRKWRDGAGNTVEVRNDGRLYCAGEFLGYRDTQGRITDGSGNFVGRLDDSGAYYGTNGQFQTRLFR